jgi:endoglucanase
LRRLATDPSLSRRAFLGRVAATVAGASVAPALLETCGTAEPAARASPTQTPTTAPASASGPLRALGGKLVDQAGREVRLTGVNWFGCETSVFAPHGLWARSWRDMLDQIAKSGFNTLRLPYSNQLLEPSAVPSSIDLSKNPDLKGKSALEVLDTIIEGAAALGLVIVLDRHRPTADAQSELWYTDRVPEQRWMDDWVTLARRYRGQPAVIGADLHNEPHGAATWGDGNRLTDWRLAAERAGNAILEANPDWLIVVEGIERYRDDSYWWGGNLRGAASAPVRLSRPDKLVYSAHDYGPEVFRQPWFAASDFPHNLSAVWRDHWAYLAGSGAAPVLMGEFGGRSVGGDQEGQWQRSLVEFLKAGGISYTYWAWNPNSSDTGGILEDDWQTVDRAKLDLLATYQWPRVLEAAAGGH